MNKISLKIGKIFLFLIYSIWKNASLIICEKCIYFILASNIQLFYLKKIIRVEQNILLLIYSILRDPILNLHFLVQEIKDNTWLITMTFAYFTVILTYGECSHPEINPFLQISPSR